MRVAASSCGLRKRNGCGSYPKIAVTQGRRLSDRQHVIVFTGYTRETPPETMSAMTLALSACNAATRSFGTTTSVPAML